MKDGEGEGASGSQLRAVRKVPRAGRAHEAAAEAAKIGGEGEAKALLGII